MELVNVPIVHGFTRFHSNVIRLFSITLYEIGKKDCLESCTEKKNMHRPTERTTVAVVRLFNLVF
jgi:hypothetical protein